MNDGVVQMKKKLLDKLIASFKETNKRTMENWLNELLKRSFFTERTSFPNEKNLQNTNEKFSPFLTLLATLISTKIIKVSLQNTMPN